MKITQKQKIEKYDSLVRENDLLTRYFWETQKATMPDKVLKGAETDHRDLIKLTASLYCVTSSYGGFVVLEWNTNGSLAHYLKWADEWLDTPAQYGSVSHDIEESLKEKMRMYRTQVFHDERTQNKRLALAIGSGLNTGR